jgi:hypothetical protein
MSWDWDASVLVLDSKVFKLNFVELDCLIIAFLLDGFHL